MVAINFISDKKWQEQTERQKENPCTNTKKEVRQGVVLCVCMSVWACVTLIAQSTLASWQFTRYRVTTATLPARWCARSPQAPLGSGGRFITYANNMTLSWKGPLELSDGGNRGQWGESEWRKNETPDGYVNVLGMV